MDKPLKELDLDSMDKITGGATYDLFDDESSQSLK